MSAESDTETEQNGGTVEVKPSDFAVDSVTKNNRMRAILGASLLMSAGVSGLLGVIGSSYFGGTLAQIAGGFFIGLVCFVPVLVVCLSVLDFMGVFPDE